MNTHRRQRWLPGLALALVAVTVLSACRTNPDQATSTASTGSTDGSLTMPDGTVRTFHVHVPPTLVPSTPVPLLVALHGGLGWGTQFEGSSGFDALADTNGFIVVYPDGTDVPISRNGRVWNGGHCCSVADQDHRDVDDVGFIARLIDTVAAGHDIDPARVFVTGHSNGAILAERLACELSGRIAAIAVQAGTLEVDRCAPTRPVSVLDLHGSADRNIPIDGGRGDRSISQTDFRSPRESIDTFASLDGCHEPSAVSTDPANPDVTTTAWTSCSGGVGVALTVVNGASHAWMGHPVGRLVGMAVGEPYTRLDASAVIWTFLAAHPLALPGP